MPTEDATEAITTGTKWQGMLGTGSAPGYWCSQTLSAEAKVTHPIVPGLV